MEVMFPQADIDRLIGQIDRAIDVLGRTSKEAVVTAANRVANSLGKSTRVAPKYRPFRETGRRSDWHIDKKTGQKIRTLEFEVESYRGNSPKTFTAWAQNIRSLKRSKAVRIGRRGLAKMSWHWAARDIGQSAGISRGDILQSTENYARRFGRGEANFGVFDSFFKLESGVGYIENAIDKNTIGTAMSRAADGMMHALDNQLKRVGFR